MTTPNCTSAPLSWLVMEQYHLGELPPTERERVRQHLEHCPGCAKCMDSIENSSIRLKPLPEVSPGFAASVLRQWKWQMSIAAVAVASAVMLIVVQPFVTQPVSVNVPPASMGYKGGDLAIGLTRYRNMAVEENPSRFMDGDAFTVRVTCPPIGPVPYDVSVFQGKDVFFPLDNRHPLECGNRIALTGGITLTGDSATTICVTVDAPLNRRDVKTTGIGALPDSTV
jgi:hypothetical protein